LQINVQKGKIPMLRTFVNKIGIIYINKFSITKPFSNCNTFWEKGEKNGIA